VLADTVTLVLVGRDAPASDEEVAAEADDGILNEREGYRAEIDQATAMISVSEPSESLSQTFVELADSLVTDFDVIDFLHLLARYGSAACAVCE
jgi:hypothetical protein